MNIDREKIKRNLLKDYRLAFMKNTIFFVPCIVVQLCNISQRNALFSQ